MSGNNQAAVDRQLKKVYDCLNIGSNKKAVQEVDRLTKNFRDLTVFKAVKSLALIRMQKIIQATEILGEINLETDLDEVTLQTMTSCCKESLCLNKIVEMYEAAAKRKPNDLDIMSHLFMAHVRVYDFKKQKEIAMHLYKNFAIKKRLHSFWAIMSLVMQSKVQSDPPASKVCLSLAEKMCEKMIDDERNQEEIELYMTILRKQSKHEDEYKFLTGPICSRLTDHLSWYKRRQAYLCLDLKMYSRAFKHYFPTLIQEYPDQLEYYQGLFKSAFLLDTEGITQQQQPVATVTEQQGSLAPSTGGTPVKFTSALAECFDIVDKQCQLCSESSESGSKDAQQTKGSRNQTKNLSRTSSSNLSRHGLIRGPFMARAELYDIILRNESALPKNVFNLCMGQFTSKYNSLVTLLLEFFQLFSKKIVCHYDLDYMLNKFNLTNEDTQNLISEIDEWVKRTVTKGGAPASDVEALDRFHIELNYFMLRHAIHGYNTSDPLKLRLGLAKEYIALYDKHLELGKNYNVKTEFLPSDHYCILAINSITTNAMDTEMVATNKAQPVYTDSVLIGLITMARSAVMNSPSNHQLKLLLLKLCSLVGASKQCSNILIELDIKHFQIDTLGHLLNPILYNTGNYNLSKESLNTCFSFYAHGLRECLECLTSSYREGRFSKIEEISNVLRKLYDSLNMAQCFFIKGAIDTAMATTQEELKLACKSFDPFGSLNRLFRQKESLYTLKDNRDFKVLRSLHFETNSLVQKRQAETFGDEKLWLRLRYHILRSAFIQYDHLTSTKSNHQSKDFETNIAELKHGSQEVDKLVQVILELRKNNQDTRYSYLEPESSSFRWDFVKLEPLLNLVNSLVFCTNPDELTQKDLDNFTVNLITIANNCDHQLSSVSSLISLKRALCTLTITLEFLSICVTSLVSLNNADFNHNTSLHDTSQNSVKSSSTSQQQAVKTKSVLCQMVNKVEGQLTKLSQWIRNIDLRALIFDKISSLDLDLSSNGTQTSVETKDKIVLLPLMGSDALCDVLSSVKEKLMDSYAESLREIENVCRRKIKLLRSKV